MVRPRIPGLACRFGDPRVFALQDPELSSSGSTVWSSLRAKRMRGTENWGNQWRSHVLLRDLLPLIFFSSQSAQFLPFPFAFLAIPAIRKELCLLNIMPVSSFLREANTYRFIRSNTRDITKRSHLLTRSPSSISPPAFLHFVIPSFRHFPSLSTPRLRVHSKCGP